MAKFYRTYWLMRRRYRWAGYALAAVGCALWAVYMGPSLYAAEQDPTGSIMVVLPDLTALLIVTVVPIILAHLLWSSRRWRYLS